MNSVAALQNGMCYSLMGNFNTHMDIDWDAVPIRELPTKAAIAKQRKQQARFLKGPIPLYLLQYAAQLSGAALATYLAARHRADLQRSDTVTLPRNYLATWGIRPNAYHRALGGLVHAGLITTAKNKGRATRVTILPPSLID